MLERRGNIPVTRSGDRQAQRPLLRFSDLVDRFFEDAVSERDFHVPKVNVAETENSFEVTVALPGLKKKEIDVSLDNNILTISGEREYEEEHEERRYHLVENHYGRFSRSMTLPNIIDPDSVKATYKNGELHITIAKQEEKAGRKIEIS